MKLDEAIENLEELKGGLDLPLMKDTEDAIKLGIEALKHYQESSHSACGCLLLGETK